MLDVEKQQEAKTEALSVRASLGLQTQCLLQLVKACGLRRMGRHDKLARLWENGMCEHFQAPSVRASD